jgi:hypothetical protein
MMSLTKDDFTEIRKIIRTEVHEIVKTEVHKAIDTDVRKIVKEEISVAIEEQNIMINAAFADVQEQLNTVNARLDQLEIEIKSLRVDLDLTKSAVAPVVGGNRDKLRAELVKVKKQVERLEKALAAA